MTNATHAIISTAINCLEALVEHVKELEEDASGTAQEESTAKAKNKLSSALGMVKDAFELLDQE